MTNLLKDYTYDTDTKLWIPESPNDYPYSDGDAVEEYILDCVLNSKDRSLFSEELSSKRIDWPSQYHLSPKRANLLRPIATSIKGPVLEIGAGMGAITRFLGEEGHQVYALEGSERRARIAAERCSDLSNVSVIADLFQNIVSGQFQTITLIGVLEYAGLYFPSTDIEDSVNSMLSKCHSLLKPGGSLIIAIENQFGLKYFAGFDEDHLGRPMVGIEGLYEDRGIKTFGKDEIEYRLNKVGFIQHEWWYPFPDYKLVDSVFGQSSLESEDKPNLSSIISSSSQADLQAPPVFTFNLQSAWEGVYNNKLAGQLSNSFLVRSSTKPFNSQTNKIFHFSTNRKAEFCKETIFSFEGKKKIINVTRQTLKTSPHSKLVEQVFDEPKWLEGENWAFHIQRLLNQKELDLLSLKNWFLVWKTLISETISIPIEAIDFETVLPSNLLDATSSNLIHEKGKATFFDLEWVYKQELTFGFLYFRTVISIISNILFSAGINKPFLTKGELFDYLWALSGENVEEYIFTIYWERENFLQSEITVNHQKQSWNDFRDFPLKFSLDFDLLRLIYSGEDLSSLTLNPNFENLKFVRKVRETLLEIESLRNAKEELEYVYGSKSWKITKPIRAFRSLFK